MKSIKRVINFENTKQVKKFLYLLRKSQHYPQEINVVSYVSGWKVLDKNSLFVLAFVKNGNLESELYRITDEAKKSI